MASVQVRRGSADPAATIVQRPRELASAQLRQAPVQSVLQQIPGPVAMSFTQCAFWHSAFALHGWPSTLGPQLPFTQAMPSAQSAFVVHLLLHAPLTHLNCPHSWTWGGWQVPRPSQERAVFTVVVVAQVADPQGVSLGYRLQPPKPSQMPVLPQVDAAVFAHIG